ncbi:hypothetical protein TEA_003043 [Camellia sinensis var. sinensis]|uniref:Uncharacterized protein n=1 Tax=Camellia sinensis var. sinensis TaxID=542762 RepID=A0A4S4D2S7_CAMSN|nr:hypothetical protein TEA_003043 [Camellia sinensis var. sinensis]
MEKVKPPLLTFEASRETRFGKSTNSKEEKHIPHLRMMETPILIATKNGITEIVEFILERFPLAMDDMNWDGKNIFLLAIENRQPHLYKLLLEKIIRTSIFRAVDNDGNTALHLAAKLGSRSWIIPGLKMQWEIKWYQHTSLREGWSVVVVLVRWYVAYQSGCRVVCGGGAGYALHCMFVLVLCSCCWLVAHQLELGAFVSSKLLFIDVFVSFCACVHQ